MKPVSYFGGSAARALRSLLLVGALACPLFWSTARAEEPPHELEAPKLVERVEAVYPSEALRERLPGEVVMVLLVDETGRVAEAHIKQAGGHGFDEAALAAVKQYRFSPGRYDGKPVPVEVTYRLRFEPPKPVEPPKQPDVPVEPPVRLRGVVRERGLRQPIAGAVIEALAEPAIKPGGKSGAPTEHEADEDDHETLLASAITDDQGRFELRIAEPGSITLRLSAPGHQPLTVHERLPDGSAIQVDYRLAPSSTGTTRYESTIRGDRAREEIARIPLSADEVAHAAGTHGDALRAVANLPGAARAPFDTGQLILRGSAPQDSLVFLNGHVLPQLYHFAGLTSVFNSDLLQTIDYMPGNFGVRYGRATGGVVDIVPRTPARDGYHGYAKLDFIDAGVKLEGPVGKGSFAVAARRSLIELVLAAASHWVSPGFTLAPRYWDYQAVLDYPVLGGRLKLLVYGSDDETRLIEKDAPDQDPGIRGAIGNREWFHFLNLYYSRSWKQFDLWASTSLGPHHSQLSVGNDINYDLDVFEFDARVEGTWRPSASFRVTGGLDFTADWFRVTGSAPYVATESQVQPPTGVLAKKPFKEGSVEVYPAAYLQGEWQLGRLTLLPGLRVDSFGSQGTTFDPRLALRLRVAPRTVLNAGLGLYHQPAGAPYADPLLGNPALRPQEALQAQLGVDTAPFVRLPTLHAQLTLFYKQLRHLPAPSDALVVRDGQAVPELYTDAGTGRVYGLEVMIRRDPAPWFYGYLAYTLLKSERRDGPGTPLRPFEFDQTHVLTLSGTARLPWQIEASLRFRYVSGTPDTPILGALYLSDWDVYLPVAGKPWSTRLPAFNQLDLRIDKRITFRSWVLSLYLDVYNVYNQQNVEQYLYSYDYRKKVALSGLPIIPSLGVKGEF